jgi:ubiquinone biosynthesis protein
VHKAVLVAGDGRAAIVAVKILRPGIRQRFRADLESQYAGARLAEPSRRDLRRLRPSMW